MYGSHCLRHWSPTKSTLSLSTAESELHGIAKGMQVGLESKSMCADLSINKQLRQSAGQGQVFVKLCLPGSLLPSIAPHLVTVASWSSVKRLVKRVRDHS